MLEVAREQALAFRVAGHHLHRRTDPLTAIAACGLQETPPGWSPIALHARAEGRPDPGDVVTVNAMRGAPYVVPRADVHVFTTALMPPDDRGVRVLVGSMVSKEVEAGGLSVTAGLQHVADAARDALAGGPLGRDDFHQALRERLAPFGDALLPWCRGCQSHHVRPGLWRALGPAGVTEMPEQATYALARAGDDPDPAASGAELVRRFLRCYGPSTHSLLAAWAQTAPAHARALFASVDDELAPVRLEGRKAFVLAEDLARLEDPPAARGIRMLGGFDPYVDQRDRELLVPDEGTRKALFPPVGRPGIVLRDGEVIALWRSRKQGPRLRIELTWLGAEADLGGEPETVARLRGCEHVELA